MTWRIVLTLLGSFHLGHVSAIGLRSQGVIGPDDGLQALGIHLVTDDQAEVASLQAKHTMTHHSHPFVELEKTPQGETRQ